MGRGGGRGQYRHVGRGEGSGQVCALGQDKQGCGCVASGGQVFTTGCQ